MADSINSNITNARTATDRAKAEIDNINAKFPQYSAGSRSYISVKGQPLAVCMNMSWSIDTAYEEIRTIDTQLPWDVSLGQITIRANLSQIIDPNTSAESQAIFSTMAATMHQPFVTLEVYDKLGARLFYSKGMFVSMNSTVPVNGLSTRSVSFVGMVYAHNVNQAFEPYSPDSKKTSLTDDLNKLTGGATKALGKLGL